MPQSASAQPKLEADHPSSDVDTAGSVEQDQKSACMKSALASLNAADQPVSKLRAKLVKKGYDEECVEETVEKLVSYGFLDDSRYAESYIRSRLGQGRGVQGIKRELRAAGIDPDNLLDVFDRYGEEYPDEEQRAYDFLKKHPPTSKNVREGAYRKLVTRGYSSSAAASASRRYVDYLEKRF